jgi:hypothetical protein
VTGQLHTLPTLFMGKEPIVTIEYGAGWALEPLRCVGKEGSVFTQLIIEPKFPCCQTII